MDRAAGIEADSSATPPQESMVQMYVTDAVKELLPPPTTTRGRKRRRAELNWVTVATYLQRKERQERAGQQRQEAVDQC